MPPPGLWARISWQASAFSPFLRVDGCRRFSACQSTVVQRDSTAFKTRPQPPRCELRGPRRRFLSVSDRSSAGSRSISSNLRMRGFVAPGCNLNDLVIADFNGDGKADFTLSTYCRGPSVQFNFPAILSAASRTLPARATLVRVLMSSKSGLSSSSFFTYLRTTS